MGLLPTASLQVTIVVVPRDRFSYTSESLGSIYEHTEIPFKLVYIDGNSPAKVGRFLEEQAQEKGFQLIRTDYYLYPNQARNLGLALVKTKYVVFIDNDVVVTPGWLNHLVRCAEETGATVVGPLTCQDKPLHETIHFAGGESHIWIDKAGKRRLREKIYKQGQLVTDVRDRLQRTQTELAEFHCVLVRRSIFAQIGLFDEAMLNTKEHLDFCMTVTEAGGSVYFEPTSIVTFVPGPPLEWTDLHYYMLRWCDAWTSSSLRHLRDKWNLADDEYFHTKYKRMGWRRYETIIYPFACRLTFGIGSKLLAKAISMVDRIFNRYLSDRYEHRRSDTVNSKQ